MQHCDAFWHECTEFYADTMCKPHYVEDLYMHLIDKALNFMHLFNLETLQ